MHAFEYPDTAYATDGKLIRATCRLGLSSRAAVTRGSPGVRARDGRLALRVGEVCGPSAEAEARLRARKSRPQLQPAAACCAPPQDLVCS